RPTISRRPIRPIATVHLDSPKGVRDNAERTKKALLHTRIRGDPGCYSRVCAPLAARKENRSRKGWPTCSHSIGRTGSNHRGGLPSSQTPEGRVSEPAESKT